MLCNYNILGSDELLIIMTFLACSVKFSRNVYNLKNRMFSLCSSKDDIKYMNYLLIEIYLKKLAWHKFPNEILNNYNVKSI